MLLWQAVRSSPHTKRSMQINLTCYLEPLTFEKADWLTIPTNNILVITPKLNVLLQPIKDKFYTPERGLEHKLGEDEAVIIPDPKAQLFKAKVEEQMRQEASTTTVCM